MSKQVAAQQVSTRTAVKYLNVLELIKMGGVESAEDTLVEFAVVHSHAQAKRLITMAQAWQASKADK
jgi:hypothetical protein